MFNWGGLLGTLLTIPAAKILGRAHDVRASTSCFSGVAVLATFGLDLPPETRLRMYFLIGLTVFGVFGSFTYYLPELFPTRLRGTGAGFCYNVGRIIAAAGPFLVGFVASQGANSLGARDARALLRRLRPAARLAAAAPGHRDQGQADRVIAPVRLSRPRERV